MLPDSNLETELVHKLNIRLKESGHKIQLAEVRRFLRARNYDVDKAEVMLLKSIEWRNQTGVKNALTWKISEKVLNDFPMSYDGRDNDGRVVFFIPVGKWDLRQSIIDGFKTEMERNIYRVLANMMKAVEDSGQEQFRLIIDLAGLSYSQIIHYESVQLTIRVLREFEANYPEVLHAAYFINSHWVFNMIFPVIKPVLTGNTFQKLTIFNSNPNKYMPEVFEFVSIENLPSLFKAHYFELINSKIIYS